MKKLINIILLQGVVFVYSISSAMSKLASGQKDNLIKFIIFFGLEFVFLGIYAILWQQMIKKFDLAVAYANRAMQILWSMLWAYFFFHNDITVKNIVGIAFVLAGTLLVNTGGEEKANE